MKDLKKYLPWAVAVGIVLVVFGTIYATVQQSQRSEANWPQIQMAQDTANQLDKGEPTLALMDKNVDIGSSLAPFTVVYNKSGKPVSGTGVLDGKLPTVPKGILTDSNGEDYNAVTWEPKDGVRIAAVTVAAKDYYVLSGRSLKEVEKNETRTLLLSALGAVAATALLGVLMVLLKLSRETH